MNKNFYLISATLIPLLLLFCESSTNKSNQLQLQRSEINTVAKAEVNQQYTSFDPQNFLTISDAEKILGEPAHLTDSATIVKEETSEFKCAYIANSEDEKTGKTGAVYFLIEQYSRVSSAKKKYSDIKKANEDHEGVKVLHDLGDEAYFHSDGENFYFIMVRKGERIFNMKVNRITSKTSLEEFNRVAKKITDVM